jgi:hypothetical protein
MDATLDDPNLSSTSGSGEKINNASLGKREMYSLLRDMITNQPG